MAARLPPEGIIWDLGEDEADLFGELAPLPPAIHAVPKVKPDFFDLARSAACHRSNRQWTLLYQVLWRITLEGEKKLLGDATDPAISILEKMSREVRRDIHKMRAFVRFREVQPEMFAAWYEPEHRIIEANAPFFQKRFTGMVWSILSPDGCLHWNRESLRQTSGISRDAAPEPDEFEAFWKTYYRSIFNPARLKIKAMQAEMPKKYWKNLPEAALIPELISGSSERVERMMKEENRPKKPAPKNDYLEKLRKLDE